MIALALVGLGVWLVNDIGRASEDASGGGTLGRPYSEDSAWNTPIDASPDIDPQSAELVAGISTSTEDGVITSDPTQYTYPVYVADANTPRYDVPCTWYKCTITQPGEEPLRVEILERVPIPADARPSAGSDGSMIVIDADSGAEYDLWMATREGNSWSVGNASVYNIAWDGMPNSYGSRGAGLPYLAGLVRHREIAAGVIEHAIAFASPNVSATGCVWPASKTDGTSEEPDALPEGARLQLDPSLTDEDFTAMGLDTVGRVIARALQEYGMILVDGSGRAKIMVEDLTANSSGDASWSEPPTELSETTISTIPVEAFRVLALPDSYYSGAAGPRHGDCHR